MPKKTAFCVLIIFFASAAFSQTITITSPRSGDTWRVGETHAITWTKSGTMDDEVKVLLFQGGARVSVIADRAPNSGSCSWTIAASVVPGRYAVRVRTLDNAVLDNSDEFAIAGPASSGTSSGTSSAASPVRLLKPNGKERIVLGRLYPIAWEARPGGPPNALADLSLWREGRQIGIIAQGIALKLELFDWTAGRFQGGAAPPGDGYTVRIQVRGTNARDESDRSFAFAPEPDGDLELVRLYNDGNKVGARIRSTFPRFAGTVLYEMRRPSWVSPRTFRYHLDMLFEGPGERFYAMENVVPAPESADCTSPYEMLLDVTNLVDESNENNNRRADDLYGHPTFSIIDQIMHGDELINRNQTYRVSFGDVETYQVVIGTRREEKPWRVRMGLSYNLRNCGYNPILSGEMVVTQVGNLFPDEKPGPGAGGFLPSHRTVVIHRTEPIRLEAHGRTRHVPAGYVAFHPVPSEIIIEFRWEDAGFHSDQAVYGFNIDFSDLLWRF